MKYLVKLEGKSSDFNKLINDFKDELMHIIKLYDDYYLSSKDFDNLTTQEIYNYAKTWVNNVNNLANLIYGNNPQLSTSYVMEIENEGTMHKHAFVSVDIVSKINIECEGHACINGKKINSISNLPKWLKIEDKEVKKAIELFNKPDWFNLYKIYEIIKYDVGNDNILLNKFGMLKSELKLFKHTANSRNAIGDKARHANLNDIPPENPMSEKRAIELIKNILKKWIEIKSDLYN